MIDLEDLLAVCTAVYCCWTLVSFMYCLMSAGALSYIYPNKADMYGLLSVIFAVGLTLGGVLVAYVMFNKVCVRSAISILIVYFDLY